MKLYTVAFVSKDGKDVYTPKHTYTGDNRDRAWETVEKLRHESSQYPQYADYNISVIDQDGNAVYSQPFIRTHEESIHDLKRQEKFEKAKDREHELKNEEAHKKAESLHDSEEAAAKKAAQEKWSEKD